MAEEEKKEKDEISHLFEGIGQAINALVEGRSIVELIILFLASGIAFSGIKNGIIDLVKEDGDERALARAEDHKQMLEILYACADKGWKKFEEVYNALKEHHEAALQRSKERAEEMWDYGDRMLENTPLAFLQSKNWWKKKPVELTKEVEVI